MTENTERFSGGEKARLVLALIVWQRPNLLLLDEPTNHLDLDMRQALTEALIEFEGALVVVSHDRHLIRSTTDDLYLVHGGKVEPFDGDLEDYQQWLTEVQKQENQPEESAKDNANSARRVKTRSAVKRNCAPRRSRCVKRLPVSKKRWKSSTPRLLPSKRSWATANCTIRAAKRS